MYVALGMQLSSEMAVGLSMNESGVCALRGCAVVVVVGRKRDCHLGR